MNPEPVASEADVLDQRRDVDGVDEPTTPATMDTEADPVDLQEQSLPVPFEEEEDWPDA